MLFSSCKKCLFRHASYLSNIGLDCGEYFLNPCLSRPIRDSDVTKHLADNANCVICGKQELDKDTIGINKKLLGTDIENFYCMECLAEYLECTVDELLDKIEEFKAEGCKLFL